MKKLLTILFCLLFILIVENAYAQSKEDYIQSSLVYKFISFFSWEKVDFIYQDDNVTLCTIGKNDMTAPLKMIGQKHNRERNKNYKILGNIKIKEIPECDILFVGDLSETARNTRKSKKTVLQKVLKNASVHNILTIGDVKYFARDGGMVGFVTIAGKTKFNMNITAIKQANLLVEPMLLELAVKVFR